MTIPRGPARFWRDEDHQDAAAGAFCVVPVTEPVVKSGRPWRRQSSVARAGGPYSATIPNRRPAGCVPSTWQCRSSRVGVTDATSCPKLVCTRRSKRLSSAVLSSSRGLSPCSTTTEIECRVASPKGHQVHAEPAGRALRRILSGPRFAAGLEVGSSSEAGDLACVFLWRSASHHHQRGVTRGSSPSRWGSRRGPTHLGGCVLHRRVPWEQNLHRSTRLWRAEFRRRCPSKCVRWSRCRASTPG